MSIASLSPAEPNFLHERSEWFAGFTLAPGPEKWPDPANFVHEEGNVVSVEKVNN
jgi:hypothetical protein